MRVFLDSSALAKRYVKESGTERVLRICERADDISLSILCVPELISAFNRLIREKKLRAGVYYDLKKELGEDVNAASIIPLDHQIVRQAIKCLENNRVKALDAIQIASAKEALCELFVSADHQQCAAAEKMKLKVERV